MSWSWRANRARKRYARWQRRIDIAERIAIALFILFVVGKALGMW